jgi:hypothetical protein
MRRLDGLRRRGRALGLTPEQLFTELHGGKSLTEVAEAQGVELETVQRAMTAVQDEARKAAIQQAATPGKFDLLGSASPLSQAL